MSKEKFDVVIVGGGPAGSNTARLLKEYNPEMDVVLFEMGEKPAGNCAGGLGLPFLQHLGIMPPEHIIKAPIREVVMAGPNEEVSLHTKQLDFSEVDWVPEGENSLGWVLDRQEWDDWQLNKAGEQGVDIRRKHTVTDLKQNGSVELQVKDRNENHKIEVEADHVGLANGPNWELAKAAGFSEDGVVPGKEHLHMGCQYHMKDPEFFEKYGRDRIYLRFDRRYAPKGYVWSFPEGDKYTRWGNGVPLSEEKNANECLDKFLEDSGKLKYKDTRRENTNAIIPTANPLETAVNGRVGLIGDTGHHCDPLHGGGMMFGARAGKAFAQAISRDDIALYDQIWQDDFLDTIQHRFIIRDLLYNMSNEEYDRFIQSIKGFEIQGIDPDIEIPRLMWHCLSNDRSMFTKTAAQATQSFVRQKLGI